MLQAQRLPQPPTQPDIAEVPATLQAEASQIDADRFLGQLVVEESRLAFDANDGLCQGPRPHPAASVQFAELRYRLLPYLAADAYGANQSPIGVRLAVLGDCGMSQIHELYL